MPISVTNNDIEITEDPMPIFKNELGDEVYILRFTQIDYEALVFMLGLANGAFKKEEEKGTNAWARTNRLGFTSGPR